MVFLALATAAAGFVAGLLPGSIAGLRVWSIALTLSVLYPIALTSTLRGNRADYEFRLLHWFPATIFILWLVLLALGKRFAVAEILRMYFFMLWSLPLVFLGFLLIVLFSLHVIRRRVVRVSTCIILLTFFTSSTVASEVSGVNLRLSSAIEKPFFSLRIARHRIAFLFTSSAPVLDAFTAISTVIPSQESTEFSDVQRPASLPIDALQAQSSLPPVIATKKPRMLSSSGQEVPLGLLLLLSLTSYSCILHVRARARVDTELCT